MSKPLNFRRLTEAEDFDRVAVRIPLASNTVSPVSVSVTGGSACAADDDVEQRTEIRNRSETVATSRDRAIWSSSWARSVGLRRQGYETCRRGHQGFPRRLGDFLRRRSAS